MFGRERFKIYLSHVLDKLSCFLAAKISRGVVRFRRTTRFSSPRHFFAMTRGETSSLRKEKPCADFEVGELRHRVCMCMFSERTRRCRTEIERKLSQSVFSINFNARINKYIILLPSCESNEKELCMLFCFTSHYL